MNNLVRIYHFGDDTEIDLIKKKNIFNLQGKIFMQIQVETIFRYSI